MVGLGSHIAGLGVRSRVWDALGTAQTVHALRMISLALTGDLDLSGKLMRIAFT